MNLVAWNCKGAFARKHAAVGSLQPDVLIVPEAERITSVTNVVGSAPVRSVEWVGKNPRKGLAALAYGDYTLRVHDAYDPRLRWILPLSVEGPVSFTLFAVWTVPHTKSGYYVQCLFEALETYRKLLKSARVAWAGDFNNNVLFDRGHDDLNFANWLEKMTGLGFQSLYHVKTGCEHGAEPQSTFFLHHNSQKGHHIDFIFATPALYAGGFEISVGQQSAWLKASDHMPIACLFHADGGGD